MKGAFSSSAKTGLLVTVPPLVAVSVFPLTGSLIGVFLDNPPLPTVGEIFRLFQDDPEQLLVAFKHLYLGLLLLFAVPLSAVYVTKAVRWNAFNAWVDGRMRQLASRIPKRAQKPLVGLFMLATLFTVVWLIRTTPAATLY
ncbi:hypothetical protein [Halomonas sp. I5-271120]|uniref:hypothetical protein n=1 Tax=Halomonas sp. I5-271120 TaxID=3061632 RepID=UPI002714600D|nr:hypothetical protein [Halomonas sp. I5-271120]